jgi:hypothetical protein
MRVKLEDEYFGDSVGQFMAWLVLFSTSVL